MGERRDATRRRSLWWSALGAVCAAALVAWLGLRLAPLDHVEAAPERSIAGATSTRERPELVSPGSDSLVQRTAAEVDLAPRTAALFDLEPDEDPDGPRVLVRGLVRAPVADLGRTSIEIGRTRSAAASGFVFTNSQSVPDHCDDSGRFEVDVTHLAQPNLGHHGTSSVGQRTGSAAAEEDRRIQLFVRADHPSCELARVELDVPALMPDSQPARDEDIVLNVELVLERATCIRGTVSVPTDCDMKSVQLVAFTRSSSGGWDVYVHPRDDPRLAGGLTFTATLAGAYTPAADGSYSIRVKPGAIYAVVAAVPGLRPDHGQVEVAVQGEFRIDLALDQGAVLRGTLNLDGAPARAGTVLSAAHQCGDHGHLALGSGRGSLCWVDGELGWSSAVTKIDAQGRFELKGLGAGSYALRAVGLGQPGHYARSVPLGLLTAPADDAQIGPPLARAVLTFDAQDRERITFSLRDLGGQTGDAELGPFQTDDDGAATLSLAPSSVYDVVHNGATVGRITTAQAGSKSSWSIAP